MSTAAIASEETTKVGRPKRKVPTTSIKVEVDAVDLVRKVATFLDQDMVEYASRVLREQAQRDLRDGARRVLDELGDEEDAPAKKPPKR